MLRIVIPSDGPSKLDIKKFIRMDIPVPENGLNTEINGNVILAFENEQEAINYTVELDRYSEALNDHDSLQYQAAGEIVKAISEDEFVQSYIQD